MTITILYLLFVSDFHFNQRYTCSNKCGKSYKHKRTLRYHMIYECGGKKLFSCYICKKEFTQNGNLKTHLLFIHKVIV